MLLYIHGLGSTTITNYISYKNKIESNIDLFNIPYKEVEEYYSSLILDNPDIKLIMGHGLGGYWALTISNIYGIPCVVLNPDLCNKRPFKDYVPIESSDMDYRISRGFHIENGDDILDMTEVYQLMCDVDGIGYLYNGGDHNIKYKHEGEIDILIEHIIG